MATQRIDTRIGIALVLPAILGLMLFHYYPIVQSVIYTFFDLDSTTDWLTAPFVGFDNYGKVIRSGQFYSTFAFTVGFTVVVVLLDLTVGMLFALATFYVVRPLRGILRAIIIIPWAIPQIIQAAMWRWMLNGDAGPLGDLAVRLGLAEQPPLFLVDRVLAIGSVFLAYTWKGASIAAFFMMGGLALIPREVTESAKVDGANALRHFFAVTLPMLAPTLYVALLYRSQDALRVFDVIYGLTGGGPGTTTDTLSSFAYTSYFRFAQFGRGATYAVVTFVLVAVVSVFYIGRIRKTFNFKD